MSGQKIETGLRTATAAGGTLLILMTSGTAVRLERGELLRVLTAVADDEPGLMFEAMERRLLGLITREVSALTDSQ